MHEWPVFPLFGVVGFYRSCSNYYAARACSEKIKFTVWAQTRPSLHCCAMATLAQSQNFANSASCAKQSLGRNAASVALASNMPFAPPPNIFPNLFPRHRTIASHSARFLQNSKSRLGGARIVHGVCTLFTPPESRDFQILTPVLRARLTHGFACLQARSAPSFPP